MPRRESPDQQFGPGISIWATADSRDLLFDLATAEERAVKTVLRRALIDYAAKSEEYNAWVKTKKPRPKAAA